jgi:hypothetical protein
LEIKGGEKPFPLFLSAFFPFSPILLLKIIFTEMLSMPSKNWLLGKDYHCPLAMKIPETRTIPAFLSWH